MGKIPLKQWDSAVHLKTEEDLAQYLDACLQEAGSDAAFLAGAPGHRGLGVDGICGCFGHGFAAVVLGLSHTQAIDAEPLCSELFNTRVFDCSCLLQVILKLHASP